MFHFHTNVFLIITDYGELKYLLICLIQHVSYTDINALICITKTLKLTT